IEIGPTLLSRRMSPAASTEDSNGNSVPGPPSMVENRGAPPVGGILARNKSEPAPENACCKGSTTGKFAGPVRVQAPDVGTQSIRPAMYTSPVPSRLTPTTLDELPPP